MFYSNSHFSCYRSISYCLNPIYLFIYALWFIFIVEFLFPLLLFQVNTRYLKIVCPFEIPAEPKHNVKKRVFCFLKTSDSVWMFFFSTNVFVLIYKSTWTWIPCSKRFSSSGIVDLNVFSLWKIKYTLVASSPWDASEIYQLPVVTFASGFSCKRTMNWHLIVFKIILYFVLFLFIGLSGFIYYDIIHRCIWFNRGNNLYVSYQSFSLGSCLSFPNCFYIWDHKPLWSFWKRWKVECC